MTASAPPEMPVRNTYALTFSMMTEFPDELANRMMMAHGSGNLLRALHGEPLLPPPTTERKNRERALPAPRRNEPAPRRQTGIPLRAREIIARVAEAFMVTPEQIAGKGKFRRLVHARAVVYRLLREMRRPTGEPLFSFPQIASYVNRDHSTICHSVQSFDIYCKTNPEIREVYERLRGEG
jgi:hypothetical protein